VIPFVGWSTHTVLTPDNVFLFKYVNSIAFGMSSRVRVGKTERSWTFSWPFFNNSASTTNYFFSFSVSILLS